MKFRKKPVVIDAIQLRAELTGAALDIFLGADKKATRKEGATLVIQTLEGAMTAEIDDWIIRGIKGELYPCKPDIFAVTYEAVDG